MIPRFFILLISISSVCLAQNNDVQFAFRTMGWGANLSNLYYLKQAEYVPLRVRESSISGFYRYSGGSNMNLYRMKVDPETKEEVYTVVSTVNLPTVKEQALVVFFGSTSNRDAFRAIAYDDSIQNVGNKDILITNFSPVTLAFQVGGRERFGLEPAASRIIRGKDGRHMQINLAAYRDGKWEAEYQTELRIRDGNRYMIFFRDVVDSPLGLNGISPTIIAENINIIQASLRNPNPDIATGSLPGGIDSYDFSDVDQSSGGPFE
jgi:hypothetical protein